MRKLFILMMLFLWVTFIFAADLMVVSEVFSQNGCPSCPPARSALISFYQSHPDRVIPIIWHLNDTSDGSICGQRYGHYPHPDGNYVPYHAVGGDNAETGGTSASDWTVPYNSIVNNPSPIAITLDYSVSGSNITINADVALEADLQLATNATVEYFFVLTDHSASAGDYLGKKIDFDGYHNFPLRTNGETGQYSATLNCGTLSPLDTHAVMVIQERGTANLLTVYQGASIPVQPFEAIFASDITSGAPELDVQFSNLSTGPNPESMTYVWNFGDGSPVSTDENPVHTYTAVGTYDVSLHVTDNVTNEVDSLVVQAYIDCIDPFNGISGAVAGHWKPEFGTYIVSDDINIAEGNQLTIDPGTNVYFEGSKKLEVNGVISITGTENDKVMLWGNPASRSLWNGIKINSDDVMNTLVHCDFKDFRNTAVELNSAKVVMNNCTFRDADVASGPGVLDIYGSSNITFSDIYAYNITTADGYSFADVNTSTNINFEKVVFANSNSVQSGILNTQTSIVSVENCLFVNNDARTRCFNLLSSSYMSFVNCTITNNDLTTPSTLKGIFIPFSGTLDIVNCIIDNGDLTEINEISNATVNVTYTAIKGGFTGTGNIDTETSDPMFTMPSDGIGFGYDGMKDWTLQAGSPCVDAGNPDAMYNDIEDPQNSGAALAPALGTVTNDMGAYGFNGCLPTENVIIANDDDFIPEAKDFTVAQDIYPNPFNPKTNIQLNIGKTPQAVTLNVYNVRGQLVKTLVNDEVMSGTRNIVWDGTDNKNNSVSTGVYFSSLNVGKETTTKKMVLLK